MTAAELSDQTWGKICAAAGRAPDVEARAALSALLFAEYQAFAYDRERIESLLLQSERMLRRLDAFAELYREEWLPHLPADEFPAIFAGHASALTNVRTESDLWCLKMLRRRPEATWLFARAIRPANKGHQNVQREWLYHRLCGIWLDYFHGDLTVTVPPWGGPPEGPLIEFMRAAMREILPRRELLSPENMRHAINRERKERDHAAQLRLDLMATQRPKKIF